MELHDALARQQQGQHQRQRQQHKQRRARHVHPEVAEQALLSEREAADQRDRDGYTGR